MKLLETQITFFTCMRATYVGRQREADYAATVRRSIRRQTGMSGSWRGVSHAGGGRGGGGGGAARTVEVYDHQLPILTLPRCGRVSSFRWLPLLLLPLLALPPPRPPSRCACHIHICNLILTWGA